MQEVIKVQNKGECMENVQQEQEQEQQQELRIFFKENMG